MGCAKVEIQLLSNYACTPARRNIHAVLRIVCSLSMLELPGSFMGNDYKVSSYLPKLSLFCYLHCSRSIPTANMKLATFLFASTFLPSLSHAFQNCGFGTPDFPAPKNLASSATIEKAFHEFKSAIDDGLASGNFSSNSTSFSVEIFSTHSQTSLFQYHHTAPNLAVSNGTKLVDSNSIYRVGSVSKLLSVYTFIIEAGDKHFHESVTKYIPELAAATHDYSTANAADVVDWESVTVGEIASQMSGIGRECKQRCLF